MHGFFHWIGDAARWLLHFAREHPGSAFDPARLAALCEQMLQPPRYLSRAEQGADVQLQQFVRE